jgi:glycosyltransferase involved in cell wall biosynthesis
VKILLFAYHFPPDPAVGAIRPSRVAEAFVAAGHHVEVVTARLPGEEGRIRRSTDRLTVHTVACLPQLGVNRSGSGPSPTTVSPQPGPATRPGDRPPGDGPAWKRWIRSLLYLPDDCQGFIIPAMRAGTHLARAGADLIYSSSPPVSVQLAAGLTRWRTGLPWVMEFRDPWYKLARMQSAGVEKFERALERRVLRAASRVVCVSEGIGEYYAARLGPAARKKLLVIRNGISALAPAPSRRGTPQPFRILHAGTFYLQRDPRPFLDALAALRQGRTLGPNELRVDLVGDCREFDGIPLSQELERRGLTDLVTIRDWIPHSESQALMASADLLLLLAQKQPIQVPNKLYEYLGTRKPILAYADADGESAAMLRRLGGHYLITSNDPEEGVRVLDAAFREADTRSEGPEAGRLLNEWTAAIQMARLVEAVASIRE